MLCYMIPSSAIYFSIVVMLQDRLKWDREKGRKDRGLCGVCLEERHECKDQEG